MSTVFLVTIVHDQRSNFNSLVVFLVEEKHWKSENCAITAYSYSMCLERVWHQCQSSSTSSCKIIGKMVKNFHHSVRATEELHKRQESTN